MVAVSRSHSPSRSKTIPAGGSNQYESRVSPSSIAIPSTAAATPSPVSSEQLFSSLSLFLSSPVLLPASLPHLLHTVSKCVCLLLTTCLEVYLALTVAPSLIVSFSDSLSLCLPLTVCLPVCLSHCCCVAHCVSASLCREPKKPNREQSN